MLIKTKLLTSYIAMVVIPIILFIMAFSLIGAILERFDDGEKLHGKLSILMTITDDNTEIFSKLIGRIEADPGLIQDRNSLKKLEDELDLDKNKAGLIVKKAGKTLYTSQGFNKSEFLKILPKYKDYSINPEPIEIGEKLYTLKMYLFLYPDNVPGMIYLISDVSEIVKQLMFFLIIIIVVLLLSLVLTNGALTWVVSKGILKPLGLLKDAAQRISAGDLDFKIEPRSRDELGELATIFEEMRRRLRESINAQLQYEKNRKELISGISHDLKTPVTAIKGYIEGIIDGVANSPQKIDKYIKTINVKVNHLDRMIDELFLFSKLDLGKIPFNFEQVDLKHFLIDFLEELAFELNERRIKLFTSINCNVPVVIKADRDKLRRVLINILENSIKYMDDSKKSKEITVKLVLEEAFVSILISDNGLGIKAKDLPFIFERFFRADQARNTETGGSGLGLATVKLIIEEHQGKIWAESEYGKGTTIGFSLRKLAELEKKF